MSKKTTRPLILYAVEPCTYIIPDIKETTAAADMTQCAFFCIFFCRNLHFMWFGAPRNVWDYKSQVWNNSSDVTTDKTHYVMTVWLVFWSKRVWNALIRPSPVIGGRSGGGRDAIHTVTPYHQNDFNIYKESPSCLFDSRHHMNALWLSVTSRETKTKCFHRERTVKLEEEKGKKKVKHILWLRRIHRESHRRREISSSPPLRWISAGGRDVQLSDSASLRDLFMKSEASISNGDV